MRSTRSPLLILLTALLGLLLVPLAASAASAAPLTGVAQVDAGDGHTCSRLTSGEVRCWGYNASGQIGDNTTDDRHLPTKRRRGRRR